MKPKHLGAFLTGIALGAVVLLLNEQPYLMLAMLALSTFVFITIYKSTP